MSSLQDTKKEIRLAPILGCPKCHNASRWDQFFNPMAEQGPLHITVLYQSEWDKQEELYKEFEKAYDRIQKTFEEHDKKYAVDGIEYFDCGHCGRLCSKRDNFCSFCGNEVR